ncbi:CoA pyrophosphatase [Pseudomonadales bacterium]|nr:CoA pyrophosphatase [Pseudomonadales bacterium]MDC1314429.1 CoA pyrophosphatase [Pseudomonadales bacterium]
MRNPDEVDAAATQRLSWSERALTRAEILLALGKGQSGDELVNPHFESAVPSDVKARAGRSSVAIVILDEAQPTIVLTKRSAKIRFGGQFCFPGGREAPGDDGLKQTALRETFEEINVLPSALTYIGCLGTYFTHAGYLIEPNVFMADADVSYRPDPDEVAEIVLVPLSALQNKANYHLVPRGGGRANFNFRWSHIQVGGPTVSLMIHLMHSLSGVLNPHDRNSWRDKF